MQIKRKRGIARHTISILIALAVSAAVSYTAVIKDDSTDAATQPKVTPPASVSSQFSFTGATDWWQGATRKTDMALFHKIQDSCFTSIQHKTGSIAADKAKLQKTDDGLVSDGYVITPVAAKTLALRTTAGVKHYQLQQSGVTTPDGASKVLGGQEFGYLKLSDKDYLFVEGYCETVGELAATIPALQAIKFDPAG